MKNALRMVQLVLIAGLAAGSCLNPPPPDKGPSDEGPTNAGPSGESLAEEFAQADQAFEKGTFQEAFTSYEKVYKGSGDAELRHKSFFRMSESLTHLFRYGEAAQLVFDTPLPKEAQRQARVLLLKAALGKSFLDQYSYILSRNESEGAGTGGGVFRLTREEVKAEIEKAYGELAKQRDTLKGMALKDEGYYFAIDDVDFGMFPTLYDFFIQQWTDFLLAGRALTKTDLGVIIDNNRIDAASSTPAIQAAGIMAEASDFMAKDLIESAEYWRIKRLGIVLDRGWPVLQTEEYSGFRTRAAARLLEWLEGMKHAGPRAYAAFKAAQLKNNNGEYVEARLLCERILRDFPAAPSVPGAKALRQQIINPMLSLTIDTMTPQDQKKLTTFTRNLAQVYFRAYKLKPAVLTRLENAPSLINYLAHDYSAQGLTMQIIASPPDFQWTLPTGDTGKHEYVSLTSQPPALKEGLYLIQACHVPSFAPGTTLLCSGLVNVTTLMVVETPGVTVKARSAYYNALERQGPAAIKDPVFRFYTLDALTGKPVPRAQIFAGWNRDYQAWRNAGLSADAQGQAALSLDITARPTEYDHYSTFPLAKKGASYAYLQNEGYFWHSQPAGLEFFIETDRPIYRPGDKLMAKISGVRRVPDGYRALGREYQVHVTARDPNGNVLFEKTLPLNESGSADVGFEIPRGKLLGAYSLEASASRGLYSGSTAVNFQVEEYKRPEFEIVFDPLEKPYRFGQTAEVTGTVKYYFGGAAANADVSFTVTQGYYVPWYYRYWFYGGYQEQKTEKASGKIKTDDKGKFRISFIPKPEDAALPDWMRNGLTPEIAQYTVAVEARDSGGRTITGSTDCKVGKNTFYFTAEPGKEFYFEKEKADFTVSRLTVNDKPLAGQAAYEVYLLKNPPLRSWAEMGHGYYRSGSMSGGLPGPEFQLKDAENLKLAAQGKLTFGADGRSTITLPALAQGAYRLVIKGRDDAGAEVVQPKIFLVVNNASQDIPINFTSVTLLEKGEYQTGDTARLLLGSRFTLGTYVVEVWAGRYFLKSFVLDNAKPVQTVDIPVTPEMKGGFTVRWFGVRNLTSYYGEASADVPWSEKKLTVAVEPFQEKLLPGAKANWGVKTLDAAGRPVKSEVLVFMYDRSLEYYNTSAARSLGELYFRNAQPDTALDSDFQPGTFMHPIREGELYKQLYNDTRVPEENLPGFRTDATFLNKRFRGGLYRDGADNLKLADSFDTEMPAPAPAVSESTATGRVSADRKEKSEADKQPGGQEGAPMPNVQARKAFADTAFFIPHVSTDAAGRGSFSFTAPEQLTSWKLKAVALTGDASWGAVEKEAVTQKDLMVRLDLPRYFREKDKGTVTAVAHNESDKPMTGQLRIDVLENDTSVLTKIKLSGPARTFTIPAHGLVTFDWPVEIPAGLGTYTVRAAAAAGTLTDAEERLLPILPSRERLIESAFAIIKGNEAKAITLPAAADPTRINESVTLEIDPQLTLSLLNTLPFLIDYPHACVEQSLNKYVPLAIVNEIYNQYPEVKKAVGKIPNRTTVTPPWETKDPRRALEIDETPWGWEAKGRPAVYPVIDLLDPAVAAAQKESVFSVIKSSQLSNGAFPWWPGGREDLYMTLYVLSGLAEVKRYGVAVDTDMVNRALAYVNSVIPSQFKPEPYQLAIVAYASYVVTSFPVKDFSEAARSQTLVRGWLDFIYKHRFALTPFGKAYLANVYFRLAETAKGDEILAMAMDGAREDAIAGVYWTPEAYSWVWYSDTVEKHAFLLKTLVEFKPADKRIPGMVQWLLWNRKGNVWKSTKASAAALSSLLDYLKKGGALLADEKYTVEWGTTKESLSVKGDDWQEKPLRLVRGGEAVNPDGIRALITKEGKGTSTASLTWIYSTDQLPTASGPGLIELKRQFFIRTNEGGTYRLKEIFSGGQAAVGDQIEVKVTVVTKSQFEYLHLKDPKAAGFEAETLLSGWKYDPLWFYEEPRDSSTNFFFDWVPHGEYVLRYRLRPTKPGEYRIGAATLQSMYAPDLNAHSAGFLIKVVK